MASSAWAGTRSRPNTDIDLVATYLGPDNYMSPNLLNRTLVAEGLSAQRVWTSARECHGTTRLL